MYSYLHAQDIIKCTLRQEICARWGRKLPMNKNRREVIRGTIKIDRNRIADRPI